MCPVAPQQTLRSSVELSGVGLHGGSRVQMRFLPALPNSGIRFRRMDLDDKPEIEARIDNVGDTTRSTSLSRGNARVHTVEHILAAFVGCGIDNAVVELDANEPPIGDGSALPYVRLIHEAVVNEPDAEVPEYWDGGPAARIAEHLRNWLPRHAVSGEAGRGQAALGI